MRGSNTRGYKIRHKMLLGCKVSKVLNIGLAITICIGAVIALNCSNPLPKQDSTWTYTYSVLAGTGESGFSGDGGLARFSKLNIPRQVTLDDAGNLFFVDLNNHRIRKIDMSSGIISTIIRTEPRWQKGDGDPLEGTTLKSPSGLVTDNEGNLVVADRFNSQILKIDANNGSVTRIAGVFFAGIHLSGFDGEGGPANETSIDWPEGMQFDRHGNLYLVDNGESRILRIDATTSVITSVAGTGEEGWSSDGALATRTKLNRPEDIAIDNKGNLYIADTGNDRILVVDSKTGIVTKIAGTDRRAGWSDSEVLAATASLLAPTSIAVDPLGNIFFIEGAGHALRRIDSKTNLMTAIIGADAPRLFDEEGNVVNGDLIELGGIAVDNNGDLYISDRFSNRIVKLTARQKPMLEETE